MSGKVQSIRADEVYDDLNSRAVGLTPDEVLARRHEVGANSLEAPKRLWWLGSLIRQFTNFFTGPHIAPGNIHPV